ncbi:relaxase [Mucilaginibacter sp. PPCGB 2223]|uniref:relaxase/mobilization nuclease domain-containing protein n=1 Tax=Mucilaginibacter sp. PPCGB 2223 TaxID=1886027 RepID=UPI00082461C9|nr:relaxase/mobilization nuclease domain-containing protein [Mucilaginibacter sp. PPCGB 2223]OCX52794.1 relaxase [Mucilaginibacter sp. PPCGB 2223]
MVARFVNGKSIKGVVYYNENKVSAGDAHLLLASGFAGDAVHFTLQQKLQRFEHLTALNTHVKTNAVHISLNFDAQDNLTNEQLQQISIAYMEHIGFGDQPYLVYRHKDAAHTHVHIATVNVQADGSRIDTHGIGWKLSEPARIALEKEFGIVQAKGRSRSNELGINSADLQKAVYGKTLTKRAITNIVNAVIRDYRFTSLAEFNAVLRQFNVVADRGGENTLMREKGGLLYSLVNDKCEQVGVPIKASSIYNKPTLTRLQKEFDKNIERRKQYREPLKAAIEKVFGKYNSITKSTFIKELQQQNINILFRTNDKGFTYGITYVDHRNKTVFNGSDLGKTYSAKAILERLDIIDRLVKAQQQGKTQTQQKPNTYLKSPKPTNYLPIALAKYQPQAAPSVTRKKKKRKGQQQDQDLTI